MLCAKLMELLLILVKELRCSIMAKLIAVQEVRNILLWEQNCAAGNLEGDGSGTPQDASEKQGIPSLFVF